MKKKIKTKLKKKKKAIIVSKKIKKRKPRAKNKIIRKKLKNKIKKKKIIKKQKIAKSDNLISKSIRLEENIKSKFKFNFKIDIFAIDRFILKFFQKIDEKIEKFKLIRVEEKRRLKLEAIEKSEKEKKR